MTILEWLVLIFIFVEAWQLFQLIKVSKKQVGIWEHVLEDPEYAGQVVANAIDGYIQKLSKDPESRESFGRFLQQCGITVVEGVKGYFGGPDGVNPGVSLPKRHWAKPFEGFVNMIGGQIMEGLAKGGKKAAKEAVESAVVPGW